MTAKILEFKQKVCKTARGLEYEDVWFFGLMLLIPCIFMFTTYLIVRAVL